MLERGLHALVLTGALLLQGCFAYCPLYATSGCLEPEGLDTLARQGGHAELVAYLHDERSWVREAAVSAVGRHRVQAGAEPVQACLSDAGEKRYVRAAAATALADLGRVEALPELARIATEPGAAPELELAILGALCRLGPQDPQTQQALAHLAEDEDILVAAAARHRQQTGCAP